jgi:hypothetical protein
MLAAKPPFYDYQPGNMTRYFIYAAPLTAAEHEHRIMFVWLDRADIGGRGMVLHIGHHLHLAYFQEKTRIDNQADAVALLCFLFEHFDMKPEGIPREYFDLSWFPKRAIMRLAAK